MSELLFLQIKPNETDIFLSYINTVTVKMQAHVGTYSEWILVLHYFPSIDKKLKQNVILANLMLILIKIENIEKVFWAQNISFL